MNKFKSKKTIKTVIWIVISLAIIIGAIFLIHNGKTLINSFINGTTIYTQTQVDDEIDKAYNQGYNDAHKNNAELNKKVEEYLKTTEEKEEVINKNEETIEQNNTKIAGLEIDLKKAQEKYITDTSTLQSKIDMLTQEKAQLQEQVDTIPGLNAEVTRLTVEIEELEQELVNTFQNFETEKEEVQGKISNLIAINTQLQSDNASNLTTITELNEQVESLQAQITALTQQMQENAGKVEECENEHSSLQTSIGYYEQFIASLETETQAVAIFEVKGAIYKAQLVTKGTNATVTAPADTETHAFVGWYVNNELVDINNHPITTTTKFVAKFDIAFNVRFMLDVENEFTTKKVAKGATPIELETLPTKPGYEFMGFTINGVDVIDYITYTINKDTTFIAKFSKLHIVTFMSGSEIITTQEVKNGDYAQTLENYANEWLLNGELIDITNYPIYADITFCEYGIITSAQEIDVGMNNENLDAQYVWNFNGNTYYSYYNKQYKFNNVLKKFEPKNWGDKKPMTGNNVWSIGENLYYSNGTTQLEYDKLTDTWNDKIWNSTFDYFASYGFNGSDVFTNNNIDYYYIDKTLGSYQYCDLYKLNKDNSTWVSQNLDNTQKYNFYNIDAVSLWTDNNELYYSNGGTQKIINLETLTIVAKVWQEFSPASGNCVINYGNKVYSFDANGYYMLNNNTGIFEETVIDSPVGLSGDRIWSDGINLYYTLSKTYILS